MTFSFLSSIFWHHHDVNETAAAAAVDLGAAAAADLGTAAQGIVTGDGTGILS